MDRLVRSYSKLLHSKIFFEGKKPMFHENLYHQNITFYGYTFSSSWVSYVFGSIFLHTMNNPPQYSVFQCSSVQHFELLDSSIHPYLPVVAASKAHFIASSFLWPSILGRLFMGNYKYTMNNNGLSFLSYVPSCLLKTSV